MFIIENYIQTRKNKLDAWKRARKAWVDDPKFANYYRSETEYERNHPYPVVRWNKVAGTVLPILVSAIVVGLLISFAVDKANDPKPPKKQEAVQTVGNCQDFNKDDHVRIQYGDYVGNNGRIVGGCNKDEAYQVKLDPDQKASVSNDGINDPVDVGGNTISVNDKKNLVKIELPEEK